MMPTTAKTRIAQAFRPSTEPLQVRVVFLDSSTQVRMLDLNELAQLSRLMPLIVLVSNTHVQDQIAPSQIAVQPAGRTMVGKAEPLKLLEKNLNQPRSLNPYNEAAFGDIVVNFAEMTAHRKGKAVVLTHMEFKTLRYLIQNPRSVISRDQLLNQVW